MVAPVVVLVPISILISSSRDSGLSVVKISSCTSSMTIDAFKRVAFVVVIGSTPIVVAAVVLVSVVVVVVAVVVTDTSSSNDASIAASSS